MVRVVLVVISLFFAQHILAQHRVPYLLPQPQLVEWKQEYTPFTSLALVVADELKEDVNRYISELNGEIDSHSETVLKVQLVDEIDGVRLNKKEAYHLLVSDKRIEIKANTQQGVYWAFQTLRQLKIQSPKGYHLRQCEITDWPAFRVRGFMHDVGRGFIPVDELKKQVSLLAQFKINVFHWHLTEDIGWRLESKTFPQLNDSANYERYPGNYYSIQEARELVQFCNAHQVLLIPEIDMPGHSAAFTRALGHDMQSAKGMSLLKQLMDEICDVFEELPYLHIGTDEVEFTNMDFVPEMVEYIRGKGKKVISWNPGWHYKTGEIDMIQMWSSRGKLHPGIPVIDSRLHYINHFDAFADIVALYNSNVAGVSEGNDDVAGSIIAVWNDRHVDLPRQIIAENGFYPAMLTLAESTWKGGRDKYFYEQGLQMGSAGSLDFDSFEDFEERMLYFKDVVFNDEPFAYVKQTNVKWRITDPFPNHGSLGKSFPPEEELKKEYIYQGNVYSTREVIGAGKYLRHVWGTLIPGFYENPEPNHTAYAYTWVYSPVQQEAGIYVRFQNYSRSEKDLPPPQGKWDYKESRIWINDMELKPPAWENMHTEKSSEVSLRNENWEGRAPQRVTLNKGWNKMLLKLPVGNFSTEEIRLVKWMFNAVLVTPDGQKALDNITYSPDKLLKESMN